MTEQVDYAEYIKANVSITDAVARYWEEPNYQHRVRCFFHNGKDKNMSVNEKDGYVHCFVCGESADVIKMIQVLFNLNFIDACKKLDDDYQLGLGIGEPLTEEEKKAFQQANEIRQNEKRMRQKRIINEHKAFRNVAAKYHKALKWMNTIKPTKKSDIDEQYYLYFEALKEVNRLEWMMDKLIGTQREFCEFDVKYGATQTELYDNLIAGRIVL